MFHVHHVRLGPSSPPAASTSREASFARYKNQVRRKLPLIDQIRAAAGCRYTEAELLAMPESDLSKLASLARHAGAQQHALAAAPQFDDDDIGVASRPTPGWEAKRPDRGIWGPPPAFDDDDAAEDAAERRRAVRAAMAEVRAMPTEFPVLGSNDLDDSFAPLPPSTWTGTK
jgi:hypothetical protein